MSKTHHYAPPEDTPPGSTLPAALPVRFAQGPVIHPISAGPCIFTGWSVLNHGAAAQTLTFLDGTDATGAPVAYAHEGIANSETQPMGVSGVWCRNGLCAQDTSQNFEGVAFIIPL